MLMYALIGISLVLLGVAGLQFTYMFYIDRVYRERKKYLQELQQKCLVLSEKLEKAEQTIADQRAMLSVFSEKDDEAWADVIGDA
jgi:16S rRNA C1402 (ribose-2'-O) methylase RsmI